MRLHSLEILLFKIEAKEGVARIALVTLGLLNDMVTCGHVGVTQGIRFRDVLESRSWMLYDYSFNLIHELNIVFPFPDQVEYGKVIYCLRNFSREIELMVQIIIIAFFLNL